jgi:hypothetical protein
MRGRTFFVIIASILVSSVVWSVTLSSGNDAEIIDNTVAAVRADSSHTGSHMGVSVVTRASPVIKEHARRQAPRSVVHDDLWIAPRRQPVTMWPSGPPAHFLTKYQKTHCGARVHNMCLKSGQPNYQTPEGELLTRSGATTVCNEAARKSKLHMVVKAPAAFVESSSSPSTMPLRYLGSKSLLLVPFCWELYGYHLLLCIMSTWTNLQRTLKAASFGADVRDDASTIVVIGFLKGSGLFPYLRGSNESWTNYNPPITTAAGDATPSKAQSTRYWPLWRILASDPSLVAPLPDLPPLCVDYALLGHIPSYDVLPAEQQAFRMAAMRRLLRPASPNAPVLETPRAALFKSICETSHQDVAAGNIAAATLNVVVIQRRQRYRIMNIDEVTAALRRGLLHLNTIPPWSEVNVEIVHLEEKESVVEQLHLASITDVLVGIHGNGLSWSMFQEPKAAIIELWPRGPYNTNYATFAQRGNLLYESVNGNGKCSSRCSASFLPQDIEAAAARVAAHLYRTRCLGESFNSTVEFFAAKEATAKRKQQRLSSGMR